MTPEVSRNARSFHLHERLGYSSPDILHEARHYNLLQGRHVILKKNYFKLHGKGQVLSRVGGFKVFSRVKYMPLPQILHPLLSMPSGTLI
ncbi:apolipoprotein N-acyltransferase [Sesbania bispinosa]|nr:apolipoprotein N-acyltransferase [Sesbania bispinosa]